MAPVRIVLAGNFLAGYPEGGGHWMVFLQYLLGLRSLGHDVWWLELARLTGEARCDEWYIAAFFRRMARYGFGDRAALLACPRDRPSPTLEEVAVRGPSRRRLEEIVRSADLLWNFAGSLPPALLAPFRHRVLVDLDPGHLQVSALEWDLGLEHHESFLTVGTKLPDADCGVPHLGLPWHAFLPPIHLPCWAVAPDPGASAPFTSVTQWTWEHVRLGDRLLSVSKRDGYLRYLTVPQRAGRPFELAANIGSGDPAQDRRTLAEHGWRLVDPHRVARSPARYRRYIRRSRAEFGCPKPIHRELRTGWFSDRSACYLACGRPVLLEDTGISERLPTGVGLVVFRDVEEAAEGARAIDREWSRHARAARALAEEFLDARRCLRAMLEAAGSVASVAQARGPRPGLAGDA